MSVHINPDPTLQNNLMSFGWECTIPNSLILGIQNKNISEIENNADIIGISGITSVSECFNRFYSGKLLEIRGEGMLPFFVTPEHPVLVMNNIQQNNKTVIGDIPFWCKAENLLEKHSHKTGHSLIIPRNKLFIDISLLDLQIFRKGPKGRMSATEFPLNENTAWILGLYTAEGSPNDVGIQFSLHKKEIFLINKIKEISKKELKHSVYLRTKENCTIANISSKILSRAFPFWCGKGAKNKKIPDFVLFNKDEKILKSFIDGYFLGDGCITISKGTKNRSAVTTSKILALQLQLSFARMGIFSHVYLSKKAGIEKILGRYCKTNNKYSILINLNLKRTFIKITDSFIIVPIRKIKKVDYFGNVYNIKTNDNTYLLSNAVVHNCDKGWHPLIQELIDELNKLPDEIEVLQVKEKYAGLRFYVSGASEKAYKIISLYENYSYHICEYCGKFWTAKERVNHGWYKTLCDKHTKKWLDGTLYESKWKKFWRLLFYKLTGKYR